MTGPRKYSELGLYKRLLLEARSCWGLMAGTFVLEILAAPLALLMPLPLKILVDNVLGSKPLPGWITELRPDAFAQRTEFVLLFAVGMLIVVALVDYSRILAAWLLKSYVGSKLLLALRAKLFGHIQDLPFAYHDTKGTMDSLYRIQYDTASIQKVATQGIIPFISSGATLIAMLYVTLQIDPSLAAASLCVIPPLFIFSDISRRLMRKQWMALKDSESRAISVVHETFGALRVVKAFGKEQSAKKHFESRSHHVVRGEVQVALTEGGFDLLIGVTIALGSAAVLFLGVRHVQANIITLGELLLVMGYLTQLYAPLQTVTRTVAQLQSALSGAERVFSVLDEEPHIVQVPDARRLDHARGEIEFRDVDFSYSGNKLVLNNVSFKVPSGTRVGIFGSTGAGKTTLMSLLLRFVDPTRGSILLDGHDLREYDVHDLRKQFGMVLQEPVLFSTSIAENIAYSRPGATEEEIVAAAQAADAHGFITNLPEGYDTVVGERGMRLSGGERQRISLARAFLRDAPILILDEPTSSVDIRTEAVIIAALDRLMQGRTTFIIAHRLSTLDGCDMWLRMEPGQRVRMTTMKPSAMTRDAEDNEARVPDSLIASH